MSDTLIVRDPESGAIVGKLPLAQLTDVEQALQQAYERFREPSLPVWRRADILAKTASSVKAQAESFAVMIATEGIKTIREARREVARCVETLNLSSAEAKRLQSGTVSFDQVESGVGRSGFFERRAAGVIVGITPFNDPLNLVAHKAGPAVAAGCPIIIKPHPQTPFSALMLQKAFHEAGLPEHCFQVLIGGVDVASQLVTDRRPRIISFTGGKSGGTAIASKAGIKRLALELGGVGLVAVAARADVEKAATAIHTGAFWAAGQNCVHAQRIVADTLVYDELHERLKALAEAIVMGPKREEQTDMGPCVDETSARRLEDVCNTAVASGAKLMIGGSRKSNHFAPTWLTEVAVDHPILHQELFGPVSTLEKAENFSDILHRVSHAGDAIHAALFTPAIKEARHFWNAAPAGAVLINDSTDFRIDAMPFGGIGSAGLGREGVADAIECFTEKRTMIFAPD